MQVTVIGLGPGGGPDLTGRARAALEGYGLPEVSYFLETFLESFSLTLDELK